MIQMTLASAPFYTSVPLSPLTAWYSFFWLLQPLQFSCPCFLVSSAIHPKFFFFPQKGPIFPYSEPISLCLPNSLYSPSSFLFVSLAVAHAREIFYHWSVSPGPFPFWDRYCPVLSNRVFWTDCDRHLSGIRVTVIMNPGAPGVWSCSLSLIEFQWGRRRRLMGSPHPLYFPKLCQQPTIATSKALWFSDL